MLAACVTSWNRTYTKPTTGCGTYGCSGGNLVCGKFHVHRCESIVEMVQFRGADDRSRDDRLRKQPR